MRKLIPIYALLTAFSIIMSVSCTSTNEADEETATLASNTLVTAFSLQENDSVLPHLDSVYFAIDVNKRIIYNPDSLPKGTKINRLVTSITFDASSTGTIKISGASTMADTTYTYNSEENDSIDFTGKVYLTVKAADGISSKEYQIFVNVHQMEPDSLYWNLLSRRDLPSLTSQVSSQHTTQMGEKLFCLMNESGNYTLASTTDPTTNNWTKAVVTFPFTPQIDSFNATADALYILAEDGTLYTSTDEAKTWTSTNRKMYSIIGGYNNVLLAVSEENGNYYREIYAPGSSYEKALLPDDFPVRGTSPVQSYSNDWGVAPQVLFLGGYCKDGSMTGDLWGFDGKNIGKVSQKPIPARAYAVFVPFVEYTGETWMKEKRNVWLAIGGLDSENKPTKKVYVSYDNGVTWEEGDDLLQLPDYMFAFYESQAFIYNTTYTATRSSSAWTSLPSRRLPAWWTISSGTATRASKPIESWECPYIYMFGGVGANGGTMNNIWKGTINRLTFKPII